MSLMSVPQLAQWIHNNYTNDQIADLVDQLLRTCQSRRGFSKSMQGWHTAILNVCWYMPHVRQEAVGRKPLEHYWK
jgi:hypothetical protein